MHMHFYIHVHVQHARNPKMNNASSKMANMTLDMGDLSF